MLTNSSYQEMLIFLQEEKNQGSNSPEENLERTMELKRGRFLQGEEKFNSDGIWCLST